MRQRTNFFTVAECQERDARGRGEEGGRGRRRDKGWREGRGDERKGTGRKQARKERGRVGNPSGYEISYILAVAALNYKGEPATSDWRNLLIPVFNVSIRKCWTN